MATVGDVEKFKEQMEVVKAKPSSCAYVGVVKLTYSENQKMWCAEFDCDLDIYFDEVEYASNNIILKRYGVPFANFCHMHQRP